MAYNSNLERAVKRRNQLIAEHIEALNKEGYVLTTEAIANSNQHTKRCKMHWYIYLVLEHSETRQRRVQPLYFHVNLYSMRVIEDLGDTDDVIDQIYFSGTGRSLYYRFWRSREWRQYLTRGQKIRKNPAVKFATL